MKSAALTIAVASADVFAIAFHASRQIERLAQASGYKVLAVEANAVSGRVRVDLLRHDGLRVTLDATQSGGRIIRDRLWHENVSVGPRHDRARADRIKADLLGFDRVAGWEDGLRVLGEYIAENTMLYGPGKVLGVSAYDLLKTNTALPAE